MDQQAEKVHGVHAVEQCLQGAGAIRLLIRSGSLSPRLTKVMTLATRVNCPVERRSVADLDALVGRNKSHQGVVLEVTGSKRELPGLDALLQRSIEPGARKRLFLLLDGVTDPGNLGACLRSAATLGVEAVIAPKNASAPLNADAIKRASGGADLVPYIQVVNLARCMEQLKAQGVWVVGTTLTAATAIADIDLDEHIAIVLGSEGHGLRENTIKHCDFLANIPMVQGDLGFNVSVAAGICLYEVERQRQLKSA